MKSLIFLLVFFAAGCDLLQKDDGEDEPRDVMAEVQQHMQQFIAEASARGVDVAAQVNAVQINIEEEIEYDGVSLCGFAPWYDDPDTQETSLSFVGDDRCWLGQTEQDNEALVFHELGHLILDRWHRDDRLPNNSRASIMVSTNLAGLYVGNALNRRTYYVDELFNEDTPVPDWAQ